MRITEITPVTFPDAHLYQISTNPLRRACPPVLHSGLEGSLGLEVTEAVEASTRGFAGAKLAKRNVSAIKTPASWSFYSVNEEWDVRLAWQVGHASIRRLVDGGQSDDDGALPRGYLPALLT